MVRAWCVPLNILDDKRLLGQHRECHSMITSQIKRILGIPGGYQNHPYCIKFNDDPGQLIDLHDKCVEEMFSRGFNHRSPILFGLHFNYNDPSRHQYVELLPHLCFTKTEYKYSVDDMNSDIELLHQRWNKKAKESKL